MSVAIVDYGSGNLHSAAKAFERAAREAGSTSRSSSPAILKWCARADRVVLPGVGAFADCRRGLDAVDGMVDALEEAVRKKGRPFFGICVGMQLLAERGREYEVTEGLGWIAGEVDRIKPADPRPENSAYGLEHAQLSRGRTRCSTACRSARRAARLFRAFLSAQAVASAADLVAEAEYGGAGHRHCRPRQHRRHAIPSRRRARSSALR